MITKITKVHDFKEIAENIEQANHNSLVLFDIDDVVVMDTDEYRLTHDYRKELFNKIEKRLSKQQCELLISVILKDRKARFVNPDIINIFDVLKQNKIPTMGLTKLATGKFGIIEDMIEWRIKELNELGVNFAGLTPLDDEILIKDFDAGYGVPTLKEGVIYTAEYDKGSVLEYILREKNYCPKSIIFIDDILENLESLQKMCNDLQINYYGFEFTGSAIIPEPDLDEQLEQIRFEILEKEYRWLTDKELKLHV
ncbi:DUF2608 domain-containing protein [Rickettsia endosymbiont of Halotydeus destructor]|uniref:DUF2608 domain-containing protein n=1 Tax=Rickettsia endosymbiont of Halotydeus destructor TaxID=2996754 RepID=UPI003BAEAF7E